MSARLSSVFPRPTASDPDDVVWTLQTAAVQWQRGLRADAIVWVRKAAEISTQLGRMPRAEELRNQAARLAEYLWSDPEEPAGSLDAVPTGASARGAATEEEDEIIEVEELDAYDLEFTETDLPTPQDAVADISPEDLSRYAERSQRAPAPLPDDLDLDAEPAAAPPSTRARTNGSFLSISPDSEPADSFISVSPEPEDLDGELEQIAEPGPRDSGFALPASDYPTQPRIERPPTFFPGRGSGAARPSATPPPPAATPLVPLPPPGAHESLAPVTARASLLGPTSPPPAIESERPQVSLGAAAPAGQGPPSVDGLAFESVEALADLPEEAQAELAASANLEQLSADEELVLAAGAALVTQGQVHVTLPFSDVSAGRMGPGAVVAARGSVESGPLRLIADAEEVHLVRWTEAQLSQAMRDCPWVVDDLRQLADRLQAHAGAGLGPLGARLDDALRAAVYERMQVRALAPEEVVAERGKPLKGLFVAAVGELLVGSGDSAQRIAAGQFVFPASVIGAEPAPADVRAGPKGGLVLFATRPVAHELMMSVPPLLEIMSS